MTKNNKLRLQQLHADYTKAKHPNFPEYALPKKSFNDNSTNGLTKCVIDFLNYSGHQAERISTTGRWIVDKGSVKGGYFIPGTGTKGSADISCTIKPNKLPFGVSVKIEIKYGKDRQSDVQKQYEQHIQSAGGIYIIVRDFDSFVEWYDNFMNYGV